MTTGTRSRSRSRSRSSGSGSRSRPRARQIAVTLALVGDNTFEIRVGQNTKLKAALKKHLPSSLDLSKHEIRLNNRTVEGNPTLRSDDLITVVPRIRQGQR